MSDIDELERRITAAMDRIGQGIEALSSVSTEQASADPEELQRLQGSLEDERLANAQLEERVRAIKLKQETKVAALEKEVEEQRAGMARLDADLQRLRKANDQLRESNQALRRANESGVGEPHLINKAMLTELEGLRAARAADASEAQAILNGLAPILAAAAGSGDENGESV